MSRFADMLVLVLPEMQLRADFQQQEMQQYRTRFASWKSHQQKEHPQWISADPLEGCDAMTPIWSVRNVFLLWQDRFLHVPLWHDQVSPWSFAWYATSKEELAQRLHDIQARVDLLAAQCWAVRDVHASTQEVDFKVRHPRQTWRVPETERLRQRYSATKRFFGRAFSPLLAAYALHEDGLPPPAREMAERGTRTMAIADVNRLVITHLGLAGYHAPVPSNRRPLEECVVDLDAYNEQVRHRVASLLMGRSTGRLPVQWALCELALRSILPCGRYCLQHEGV